MCVLSIDIHTHYGINMWAAHEGDIDIKIKLPLSLLPLSGLRAIRLAFLFDIFMYLCSLGKKHRPGIDNFVNKLGFCNKFLWLLSFPPCHHVQHILFHFIRQSRRTVERKKKSDSICCYWIYMFRFEFSMMPGVAAMKKLCVESLCKTRWIEMKFRFFLLHHVKANDWILLIHWMSEKKTRKKRLRYESD